MMLCIFNIVTIFPLNCYKKWGFWMLTLCPPSYILSSSFHSQVRATITNTSRINVTILPHRIVRALLIPKAFRESRLLCWFLPQPPNLSIANQCTGLTATSRTPSSLVKVVKALCVFFKDIRSRNPLIVRVRCVSLRLFAIFYFSYVARYSIFFFLHLQGNSIISVSFFFRIFRSKFSLIHPSWLRSGLQRIRGLPDLCFGGVGGYCWWKFVAIKLSHCAEEEKNISTTWLLPENNFGIWYS